MYCGFASWVRAAPLNAPPAKTCQQKWISSFAGTNFPTLCLIVRHTSVLFSVSLLIGTSDGSFIYSYTICCDRNNQAWFPAARLEVFLMKSCWNCLRSTLRIQNQTGKWTEVTLTAKLWAQRFLKKSSRAAVHAAVTRFQLDQTCWAAVVVGPEVAIRGGAWLRLCDDWKSR